MTTSSRAGQAVEEDQAVEVVVLMLNHPRDEVGGTRVSVDSTLKGVVVPQRGFERDRGHQSAETGDAETPPPSPRRGQPIARRSPG